MSNKDTWRVMISEHMSSCEKFEGQEIIANTLTEEELNREFYSGYGGEEGVRFTAWTQNYVLFPACYDGAEWVESVPRYPCEEKTFHVGGG